MPTSAFETGCFSENLLFQHPLLAWTLRACNNLGFKGTPGKVERIFCTLLAGKGGGVQTRHRRQSHLSDDRPIPLITVDKIKRRVIPDPQHGWGALPVALLEKRQRLLLVAKLRVLECQLERRDVLPLVERFICRRVGRYSRPSQRFSGCSQLLLCRHTAAPSSPIPVPLPSTCPCGGRPP